MADRQGLNLFLNIYELAFGARDAEIFNNVAEEITSFLGAFSCSIWIKNFRAIETETRLAYYNVKKNQEISQLDYDISCQTMISMRPYINKIIDGEKGTWFYISQPFEKRDLTGCYTIWFKNSLPKDFGEDGRGLAGLPGLANIIKNVVSHFLTCNRFDCGRIIQELGAAQKIQTSLTPTKKPRIPNVSIGVRSLVANEVGGDYLDLIELEDKNLGIAVGDAMGTGIPGAFIMLTTRAVFRLLARTKAEPDVILRQLNTCLTPELIEQNMFISLFYGIYNPQSKKLKYAVAGHNPPIIFRRDKRQLEDLEGRGLIIGGKPQTSYKSFSLSLGKGDIVIIYTDGVKDTKSIKGQAFGIEGIKNILLNYAEYDAEGIGNCLAHALNKYSNNKLSDDASFIILKAE